MLQMTMQANFATSGLVMRTGKPSSGSTPGWSNARCFSRATKRRCVAIFVTDQPAPFHQFREQTGLFNELEIFGAVFGGLDPPPDAAVLTGTTRLLLVGVVEIGPPGDRLAIGDLGRARLDLAAVLALHPLDIDVEVKLPHTRNHGLVALWVHSGAEGGIFAHEAAERLAHVVDSFVVDGLDGDRDHRFGNVHRRHRDLHRFVGKGIARPTIDPE